MLHLLSVGRETSVGFWIWEFSDYTSYSKFFKVTDNLGLLASSLRTGEAKWE
jgi:hypothetical protein